MVEKKIITGFNIAIIILILVHHFFFFFGHYGFDDIEYAGLAEQLVNKKFALGLNHYGYRWGEFVPIAFFYKILGMSDFSSGLWSMFIVVSLLLLVQYVSLKEPLLVRITASLLCVFSHWIFFYSDKMSPDMPIVLGVFGALSAVFSERFINKGEYTVFKAFLAAACLTFAVLTKETIVLLFPTFAIILFIDLFNKQNLRFWAFLAGFSLIFAVAYLLLIYAITGNALQRFAAIEAGAYFNPCSYDQLPRIITWKRIGYEFWQSSITNSLGLGIVFTILAIAKQPFKIGLKMETPASFWSVVFITAILSANFMSISIKSYVPMCNDIRHFLYLMPISAVLIAPVLVNLNQQINLYQQPLIVIGVLITVFAGFIWLSFPNGFEYIAVLSILLLFILQSTPWFSALQTNHFFRFLPIILLALALIGGEFWSAKKDSKLGYKAFKEAILTIHKQAEKDSVQTALYGDEYMARVGAYLIRFDTTHQLRFRIFNDKTKPETLKTLMQNDSLAGRKRLQWHQWYSEWLTYCSPEDVPPHLRDLEHRPKVYDKNGVLILSF